MNRIVLGEISCQLSILKRDRFRWRIYYHCTTVLDKQLYYYNLGLCRHLDKSELYCQGFIFGRIAGGGF